MTDYRLFGSTNGPATAVTFGGSFISGMEFAVNGGNRWFEGYWWWVASNQLTTPRKCALWSVGPGATGQVVPGTVVTSGTLTASQWNYIPIPTPVPLSPCYDGNSTVDGGAYIAAVGCNGNFPDTNNFWGTTGASGLWGNNVIGSPLFAYSGAGLSFQPPYGHAQGVFSTAGSDPSTTLPLSVSGTDNFWVDVQLGDVAPASYLGPYRIWPNLFSPNNLTTADSAVAYNVATQVNWSQAVSVSAIHYYVPPNCSAAAGLATSADIWNIGTQTKIATISSPSWTTDSGGATPPLGSNAGFWARAAFSSPVLVPAGQYRISVYNSNGALGGWSPKDFQTGYYQHGVAANGISWPGMSVPNQASAALADFFPGSGTGQTGGQPVFAFDGLDSFPHFTTGLNPAQNYWVDPEYSLVPSGNSLLMAGFPL